MEDKKYKVIPNDVLVDIQLSGVFMSRIQSLSKYLASSYGNEKFVEFAKHVIDDKGEPRNEIEEHIVTLTSLLNEFETKADEQGKTKELTLDQVKKYPNEN